MMFSRYGDSRWISTQAAIILTGLSCAHLEKAVLTGLLTRGTDYCEENRADGRPCKRWNVTSLCLRFEDIIRNYARYYNRPLDDPRAAGESMMIPFIHSLKEDDNDPT